MIDWINIKEKGNPGYIHCCLVIYQNDYEFARWQDGGWEVYLGDEFKQPQSPIEFYALLNTP